MSTETDELLDLAASGDRSASHALLARHRERLRRLVDLYLDRRVRGRVDPSDVVQEALTKAYRRLAKYLEERPIAFYPWLRRIAIEQVEKAHRRHLEAQKRSVKREGLCDQPLPNESAFNLANRLIAAGSSPSRAVEQQELRRRVRDLLGKLPSRDRQVLVLRYLEGLSMSEIADISGDSEAAVKMRHLRALERLRRWLDDS
jgi:RNA polymerase sigma-70 factor (ECF subfamily)